jgi:hypothetical protein
MARPGLPRKTQRFTVIARSTATETIQLAFTAMDCFASLAMTGKRRLPPGRLNGSK